MMPAFRAILAAIILLLSFAPPASAAPIDDAIAAYEKGDYAAALPLLRTLAEQGSSAAQFYLGVMYSDGLGVPQDYAEALKWLRLAADKGIAEAQYSLGAMYDKGRGVAQND